MNTKNLKESIFKFTIEGIMKMYNLDKEIATKIVNNSGLSKSIEISPDLIAHCSQEQLVDMAMR